MTPEENDMMTGAFSVFTLLVERGDDRWLIGYNDNKQAWEPIWSGSESSQSYEKASEEWMQSLYSSQISSTDRHEAADFSGNE